ncbi:hypothetical protein PEQA60_45180 [Pseudomonas sp. Eqa60]|nr:hypothetical protein PEQA60_45180 [Pseudomonas sp. Eqa60]
MLAREHFVGGLFDQAGDIGRDVAVAVVDPRRGFLDQGQGMQHRQGHAFVADGEVDQRTLGLRAPVGFLRDFNLAQAVGFDSVHRGNPPSLTGQFRP